MEFLHNINIITLLMLGIFIIPILVGIFYPLSGNRIRRELISLLDSLECLGTIVLAFYFTSLVFSNSDNWLLNSLYQLNPSIRSWITSKNIEFYTIVILILLFVINGLLHIILTVPLNRYVILPLSKKIANKVSYMSCSFKRFISGIWQLPKSICLILILTLLLNVYCSFYDNSLADNTYQSSVYQLVDKQILSPIISSAKQIPVLFNNSFKEAIESESREFPITIYFNGTTLNEAVKSTSQIDDTAKKIVGKATDNEEKAYLLYKWISNNIQYDYSKLEAINSNSTDISSGAKTAYTTKKGVCFDYSCLYVAMCRAVGLQVRFITGLGYSGEAWGDHSWNQVYYPQEKRWINVDTTFGSAGADYFDRSGFCLNHQNAVVEGEW